VVLFMVTLRTILFLVLLVAGTMPFCIHPWSRIGTHFRDLLPRIV
jgi:hypothetical protein